MSMCCTTTEASAFALLACFYSLILSLTMNYCSSALLRLFFFSFFFVLSYTTQQDSRSNAFILLSSFAYYLPSTDERLLVHHCFKCCMCAYMCVCVCLAFSFSFCAHIHTARLIDQTLCVSQMAVCVCVRTDDAQRRNAGDDNDVCVHTYYVYRFC